MNNPQTDIKDRTFSALVYLFPLIYALPFGFLLFKQFPAIQSIIAPLFVLYLAIESLPFAGLIIFFGLWLGVVRNERLSYFIKFNTMQAILLNLLSIIFSLIINVLLSGFGEQNLLVGTLNNTIFLGTLVACLYGIVQSVRGLYAQIPTLSDAANSQII